MSYAPTIASATHIGLVSSHNEDQLVCENQLGLWVVADGMGGHAAGEIASQLAVKAMLSSFRSGSQLHEAVADAHPAVLQAIENDPGLAGMGTTMVAACLQGIDYQVAWIGDSRCYHWRHNQLHQITRDHSYLQSLLENDAIEPAVAYRHPERKSLTQAIGVSTDMHPRPGCDSAQLYRDEYLLLCSDGLTDELNDTEIARLMASSEQPDEIVHSLLAAALAHGGRDNISLIVVRAGNTAPLRPVTADDQSAPAPRRGKTWLAVAMVIAAAVLAYQFLSR